jgi:hypothetical protein
MKTVTSSPSLLFLSFTLLLSVATSAQESPEQRVSPLAVTATRYKDAYLKIIYSQPQKKGREIFGSLVPYGKVWRTGANEATEITTTKDITVNGTLLKAGTYSLFTIPNKDKWTIIINGELGLWGSYNYNQKLDIMRFDVPVQLITDKIYQQLTLQLDTRNSSADLLISWDNVKVSIPLKFLN